MHFEGTEHRQMQEFSFSCASVGIWGGHCRFRVVSISLSLMSEWFWWKLVSKSQSDHYNSEHLKFDVLNSGDLAHMQTRFEATKNEKLEHWRCRQRTWKKSYFRPSSCRCRCDQVAYKTDQVLIITLSHPMNTTTSECVPHNGVSGQLAYLPDMTNPGDTGEFGQG